MASLPDDRPCEHAAKDDAQSLTVEANCALVERAEIVWTVAAIALVLIAAGLLSMLWTWAASSPDPLSAPPRFLTDINAAPAAELALLPGIGPELAARIVAERETSGRFITAEHLSRVRGIGPKTIQRVIPLVICGGPPLTAAPAAVAPEQSKGVP